LNAQNCRDRPRARQRARAVCERQALLRPCFRRCAGDPATASWPARRGRRGAPAAGAGTLQIGWNPVGREQFHVTGKIFSRRIRRRRQQNSYRRPARRDVAAQHGAPLRHH